MNYLIKSSELLKRLIRIPSFSREEGDTAALISDYLEEHGVHVRREGNNVYAFNKAFDTTKPNLLLNSHHDTVKPNAGYTLNPFEAIEKEGRLYGLGANDAGASLVCLLHVFLHYCDRIDLPFNLIFAASAEEEISGTKGMEHLLDILPEIDFAIVGEPTSMNMAISERGLLVVDCVVEGRAAHVANDNGDNAIHKAIDDLVWLRSQPFEKVSETQGRTKVSTTVIRAGELHNVVPDTCRYVIDIRLNDCYTHSEILQILSEHLQADIKPRSTRLKPSKLSGNIKIEDIAERLGIETYGSSTLSDMALMNFDSVKIGPGDTLRSHTADEYIELQELQEGLTIYFKLINALIENHETLAKKRS